MNSLAAFATLTAFAGYALLAGGLFFIIVAAIGVIRLPDMLCRAHAVAKALTLGIALMLVASMLLLDSADNPKFLLAIVFQFLTIPVASHLVSLAAYKKRFPRWRNPEGRRIGEP